MANKRIRQKQERQRLMTGKSLEGYEKHLLQEANKWLSIAEKAEPGPARSSAFNNHRKFIEFHLHLRRFYFDV